MARALALLALVSLAAFVSASSPEGEAYLKANALKEGVVTLPSGLQYKARELAGMRTRALATAPGARGRAARIGIARAATCACGAWPATPPPAKRCERTAPL